MTLAPSVPLLMMAEEAERIEREGRWEVVEGEVRQMVPAGGPHGRIAARISRLLDEYAEQHGGWAFGAETGFTLAERPLTMRAPDAAYVDATRVSEVGDRPGFWPGAPLIAVEVVSPGDRFTVVHEKALDWLAAGTAVVLVADPGPGRVTRYRSPEDIVAFAGAQQVDCSPALPGFAPTVARLLAR